MANSKFEAMTRLGFAARALIYFMIGYLALESGRTEDGPGVLAHVNGGAGGWLVGVMAVGLFGYGAWRLSEAWIDSEAHGADAKGLVVRAGGAMSGLIHLFLGYFALSLALGDHSQMQSSTGTEAALDLPGGAILVGLAAAGLVATGAYQLIKAYRGDFLVQLDQQAARLQWVGWLGRAGYAARGIVFLLMAWFFWRAASEANADQAADMGTALGSLNGPAQTVVAAGLLLFGLFSVVEALYRRIHDPHLLREMRARLAG